MPRKTLPNGRVFSSTGRFLKFASDTRPPAETRRRRVVAVAIKTHFLEQPNRNMMIEPQPSIGMTMVSLVHCCRLCIRF